MMQRTIAGALLAIAGAAYADVSGTPALTANTGLNLDTGATVALRTAGSSDLIWTGTSLEPQGKAVAVVNAQLTGQIAYDALPEATLNSLRAIASSAAIPEARLPVNQILVVFTNGGHTAKILVTGNSGGRLTLRFTTFISAAPTGPVISRLLNNSSRVSPGLPHYGIAPSSIFVITGANLADPADLVLQSSASPGLPAALNGASISVTVGGVTTRPPIYYTTPTQIAAVLPASTPVGTGTLTLTHNGASVNTAITVVSNALGFNTYNGSAVATDGITGALIGYTNSASPGQTVVLWTTGLGANPADSDTTFAATPHSVAAPLHIYIGGVEGSILYQGSAGYPGVNQINLTIPPTVPTGCFVSLVAVMGSTANHATTLPIQNRGGACADAVNGLTGNQVAPQGGQTLRAGLVSLVQTTGTDTRGAVTTSSSANAAFEKYSGLYPNTNNLVSPGSCIIIDLTPVPVPTINGLDAGTITLTGPAGLSATLASAFGIKGAFTSILAAGAIPATGGAFTFRGSGGADVGPFTSTLTLANPLLRWTNPEVAASILKTQGLTVTWTGGNPGTFVNIHGSATLPQRGGEIIVGGFSCLAPVEAGRFTVPSYILSALPDANGGLGLQNLFFLPLTASGLDAGVAGGTIAYSATSVYRTTNPGLSK